MISIMTLLSLVGCFEDRDSVRAKVDAALENVIQAMPRDAQYSASGAVSRWEQGNNMKRFAAEDAQPNATIIFNLDKTNTFHLGGWLFTSNSYWAALEGSELLLDCSNNTVVLQEMVIADDVHCEKFSDVEQYDCQRFSYRKETQTPIESSDALAAAIQSFCTFCTAEVQKVIHDR